MQKTKKRALSGAKIIKMYALAFQSEAQNHLSQFKEQLNSKSYAGNGIDELKGYACYRDLLTSKRWAKLETSMAGIDEVKQALIEAKQKSLLKRAEENTERVRAAISAKPAEQVSWFKITVEWKKNRTWGANPRSEMTTGVGFYKSGSIGGCGYDKRSTAVAEVLNQVPDFWRAMLIYKANNVKGGDLNTQNRDVFGYGSGYGITPYFEGGVGVSCYVPILAKLGFTFEEVAAGKSFNVYHGKKIVQSKTVKK